MGVQMAESGDDEPESPEPPAARSADQPVQSPPTEADPGFVAKADGDAPRAGTTTPADPGLVAKADGDQLRAGTPTAAGDRFAVSEYVPPPAKVSYDDRRSTPQERAERRERSRRRRRRRIAGRVMIGIGAVLLAALFWVGWRGYQAYRNLQTASAQVAQLQKQLTDITRADPAATAETVSHLQNAAGAARSAVDDPVYRAASLIPFLGPNLGAIREVAVTVDSLATDVMPSMVEVARALQPAELAPTAGAINLEPLERISPLLQNADAAVNQARQQMGSIDRTEVINPVDDAVLTLWHKLDAAAEVTGPGARIARLLPPMLGSQGARTYLVAFQNLAELRATGGILGSFALVRADHGKITILDQGASSRRLGYFDPPVAELTKNERELYSQLMAQYPQDVNFTPNFPTAAPLFAEMYRLRKGTQVDGVVAIDPVALSYTLKGAAPIDVGDGFTVTSQTIVPILLSTTYQKFDQENQSAREVAAARDEFLANATALVFSEMTSGHANAAVILDGLRKAAGERRILLYSADKAEQADIALTGLAGTLNAEPAVPSIGVFLNDGTGAKLGYYLHNDVAVTPGQCRPDGRRELQVTVTMHYNAPAKGLPAYVTGLDGTKPPYTLKTNMLVFAPVGGGVVGAQRDGVGAGIGRGEDLGRSVGTMTIALNPGESTRVTFTVVAPGGADPAGQITPGLILTPMVTAWATSVDAYNGCSPTG